LKTKIEQMLAEARVLLPGGQALLGFQFVATLTKSFHVLPISYQYIHVVDLCAIALAVTLLMTPAALHWNPATTTSNSPVSDRDS